MKKVIAIVLSLMLLVAFAVGCKPAAETPKPEETKPAEAPATAPAENPAPAPAPAPAEAPAHK